MIQDGIRALSGVRESELVTIAHSFNLSKVGSGGGNRTLRLAGYEPVVTTTSPRIRSIRDISYPITAPEDSNQ